MLCKSGLILALAMAVSGAARAESGETVVVDHGEDLVDIVTPQQEVTSGIVRETEPNQATVKVEEPRDGALTVDSVVVTDPDALAGLHPGDLVLIYREPKGNLVFGTP